MKASILDIISSEQEQKGKFKPSLFKRGLLFFASVFVVICSIVLPLYFFLGLKSPDRNKALVFFFIGFISLVLFLIGGSGKFFYRALLYAFFIKLPIKPNHSVPIRSILPTDYKIKRQSIDKTQFLLDMPSNNNPRNAETTQEDKNYTEERPNGDSQKYDIHNM